MLKLKPLKLGYTTYNVYVMTFLTTIGGMIFGFDISSMSAFIGQKSYNEFFNSPDSVQQGGITGAMPGGSFCTSLIAGFVADHFGRVFAIQTGSFLWMVGAAVQSSCQNEAQLIIGRFISGCGIGFTSSEVPVYIAEVAPKHIRGRLVGVFQWAITWGILIMFYIGYGCSFLDGVKSFRTGWGIQIIPGAFLLFGTLIVPESPRWLAKQDEWEKAIDIITKVQANGNHDNPQVIIEIEEIKEVIRIEKDAKNLTILDLFRKDSLNRTIVGIFGQIWQQLTGMNVLMYYVVYVFDMAGFQGNANLVASSIQYVINMLMTIPYLLFIDKWGRRNMFIVGSILMMTWQFALAGTLATYSKPVPDFKGNKNIRLTIPTEHKAAAHAVIAFCYLFVASFAPTWGPGMWTYISEIFPMRQRAVANGVCAAADWIFNFAITMFTPSAFVNITWKTYIIFGVFNVVMTIHVFLQFPETKNKTLEELTQMWDEKVPAWRTASWEPSIPVIAEKKLGHNLSASDNIEDAHSEDNVAFNSATAETQA